jgi:peroxiredoxin
MLVQKTKKLKVLASRPERALEVKPGTRLPALEGVGGDGGKQNLSYGQDSRKTVLLVFSPRCRVCKENMPNWDTIISELDQQSFRVAAISLQSEGAKEYASQFGIDRVPIFTDVNPKSKVAYNLALTPQVILIDSAGKAEKVWTGLLNSENKQEMEQALKLRFPFSFSAML